MEHRRASGDATSIVACYREYEPCPALRGRVRTFFSFAPCAEPVLHDRRVIFEVRFAAGDRFRAPLFADGNASIVFDMGAAADAMGVWSENGATSVGHVIGPMSRVTQDAREGLPAMVGAYLQPAQLPVLAGVPSSEISDRILGVEELWGSEVTELSERIASLGERGRIDLLEDMLLRQMSESRAPESAVDVAGLASYVVRHRGRVSVDVLARLAGVSRQHLTRVFRERVGVSPKLYCRLARFQSALAHASAGADWARTACELGYADQSQMIREFREFSSLTPQRLVTERWFHPFIERARFQSR